jgi:flagellin FlaB
MEENLHMFRLFKRNEKGITGLETAIILIAFVVVAAVFAYTVLSAGLFSTQKAQEAAYSALNEAESSVELKSPVILTANTTGSTGKVQQISFCVANFLGSDGMDFTPPTANTTLHNGLADESSQNKVVINYVDINQTVKDLYWTVDALGVNDGDYLLEKNEKFEITIGSSVVGSGGGNLVDALTDDLSVNTKFDIILSTPAGAILQIERTTPGSIDKIMNLR